jgi:hypothetical protein
MVNEVVDSELLARHLFNRKLVRQDEDGVYRAKPQAFMPLKDKHGHWVISVTRVGNFADQAAIERNGIWVGREAQEPRVLHGHTTITAAQVRSVEVRDKNKEISGRMDVVKDEPPPFHAHIVKYPDLLEGENPKLLQKDCAEDLAERAAPVTLRTLPLEDWENAVRDRR